MTIEAEITALARAVPAHARLAELAEAFVIEREGNEEFDAWVRAQATNVVHELLRARVRSDRAVAVARDDGVDRFEHFVEQVERGAAREVSVLDIPYCVNHRDEWVRLGDMRQRDLLFVARDYDVRAKAAKLEADFFRAIARRIGDKKVEDVFSPEALLALRREAA